MNLKGFKKIAEDKGSATLQNEKGHKLIVMVSKLSPIEKEALKRLEMTKSEKEETAGPRKMYEEGSKDQPVSADDNAPTTPAPVTVNIEGANTAQPQVAASQPNTQIQPPPVAGAKVIGPTANLPAAAPGVEQEETGLQQQQQVQAEQAKQSAISEKAYLDKRQQIAQQDEDHINELTKHADDFANAKDKNGNLLATIRPNAYQQDMTSGQKVTNAIGMLLAGFGGAGPQAMDFLNKQIDRNVQAQQQNFQNQNTIYHAYENLYHDKNIATNLAKASNIDILDHQMKLTANRLGTAQAQAAYNQASGALKIKRAQEIGMAAQRLTGLRNGTVQPISDLGGNNPQAQGKQKQGAGASENWDNESQAMPMKDQEPAKSVILNPNSEQLYKSLAYTPKAKEQLPEITKQYNQAVQSQKALDAIAEKFPQLKSEATYSDYLANKINPHIAGTIGALGGAGLAAGAAGLMAPLTGGADLLAAAPAVAWGGAKGAAAGEVIGTGLKQGLHAIAGQSGERYDADKSALVKVIGAALKGTNVNSDQIQDVVESNTPKITDDKETYNHKMKNIQDFIKQNTETGLLKTWGLSKE